MSFSSQVKEELLKKIGNARHCRIAELSALVYLSGSFQKGQWRTEEDNPPAAEKTERLSRILGVDRNTEEGRQTLKLTCTSKGCELNPILVERSCCKQAFIRGAFLAVGSLTNPEKGYHSEFACHDMRQAELIKKLLGDFSLGAKIVPRKKYQVVYLKDGSMIVDLLNIMGAHVGLMDMENVRILKDVRNSVNRRVNCETANLNKTVSAAVKQTEDIEYIIEKKGLAFLPDNLREIAKLRMEEPDLSLQGLGELLNPPLGKSGVNHRLRKISEIANTLRRSNND